MSAPSRRTILATHEIPPQFANLTPVDQVSLSVGAGGAFGPIVPNGAGSRRIGIAGRKG